jgi:hypothetical protein
MHRLFYVAAFVSIALVSGLAISGLFIDSTAPSTAATPASTAGYTPTPGFEYFPSQYKNAATKVEDHIEAF